MNTQKIFLFIAIFLTVFLLWNKWELTQTTDEYGNTITQTNIVASDSQDNTIDVPEVSDIPSAVATNIEDATPLTNESIDQGPYTTVTTDLLTLQISHKGGTIINAAKALKDHGAAGVKAYITHPVLSGPAIERLNKSEIDELVVTNSIPLSHEGEKCSKIRVISLGATIAECIKRLSNEESLSEMFI